MYNSYILIRKDILIVHKFLLLLIPYFIIMGAVNLDTYGMFVAFPSMLMLINSCTLEGNQTNQRFLVSLPVRRHELVLAKYLSIIPFVLFGLASTLLIYLSAGMLGREVGAGFWKEVGISSACVPIVAAFYLPIYYWLGTKGAQIVNLVFMMLIFLGTSSIGTVTKKSVNEWPFLGKWIESVGQNNILLYVIAGIAYLLVISCSYMISVKLFKNKDI